MKKIGNVNTIHSFAIPCAAGVQVTTTPPDPELVGGILMGWYPVGAAEQPRVPLSFSLNADGSVTIETDEWGPDSSYVVNIIVPRF